MVEEIISKYDKISENVLSVLEDLQTKNNYLSEETLRLVAEKFNLPLSRVYSIATFYKAFSLKPKGKHHICVCTGTACHVRGADRVVDKLTRDLGIKPGDTTEDGKFSFETVNCIGTCALGPVVMIDGEYHGKMNTIKISKILTKYKNMEEKK